MATVNPKYTKSTLSLWSNTILRVSHYRIKDVNLRTERLGQLEREKEREKERDREKKTEFEACRYPVRDCRFKMLKLFFFNIYFLKTNLESYLNNTD